MSVSSPAAAGILYIVPTPIGNLEDITQRALSVLRNVNVIAAEDTRHSGVLLQHFAINTALVSVHEHNESQRAHGLIKRLLEGENIALISDAGTPLISDPGYVLVNECRSAGITVTALPGPCAFVTALSGAGLPTDKVSFCGFLPVKHKARLSVLSSVEQSTHTTAFYEAPRRIITTLQDIADTLGPHRQVAIAKEITKAFEHYEVGTALSCIEWLEADSARQKGEFVVLIGPDTRSNTEIPPEALKLLRTLSEVLPLKKAAAIVAEHYELKKNALYQKGLEWHSDAN
ncbi:16S rRNA (cytidine(1402)-2'-O)-methyltransferase [Alteromonas sediminis]|uniref:Ribosomal RNA small subunit methyltransferase I n=1 Tax=Alteromonas sediminis TaxID=2259342 RepID=A0A3N5Y9G0_9ALTE|nr:16S rRNA (cytidine(1402)-2'-O)-methyltransferase [Alteromonas sediminis]RPJ67889.1 16S rRNA (cytidine(1402)-2'-O)-methyltransferase [Alteromonas sediminis]